MRGRIASVLIVVALVVGAGVGYLGNTTSTHTVTETSVTTLQEVTTVHYSTTVTLGSQPCAASYPPAITEGTKRNSSFLVFTTNSTAEVCVQYYFGSRSMNYTHPPVLYMLQNAKWVSPVNLTATLWSPYIFIAPNSTAGYTYQITPTAGTHAIYGLGLPYPCWGADAYMILGVGYSPSELESMSLVLPNQMWFCPAINPSTTINGTTNLLSVYSK